MSGLYNKPKALIAKGDLDLEAAVLKIMLVTSAYVFNPDHGFLTSGSPSPSGAEVSGTGYTGGFAGSGRHTLAGKLVTQDDVDDVAHFDANDETWSAINVGALGGAVIYVNGTSDADSIPVFYITLVKVTNGGDYILQWNVDGIMEW